MYVSNYHEFGHLINADTFDTSHVHNELYEIYTNQLVSCISFNLLP